MLQGLVWTWGSAVDKSWRIAYSKEDLVLKIFVSYNLGASLTVNCIFQKMLIKFTQTSFQVAITTSKYLWCVKSPTLCPPEKKTSLSWLLLLFESFENFAYIMCKRTFLSQKINEVWANSKFRNVKLFEIILKAETATFIP